MLRETINYFEYIKSDIWKLKSKMFKKLVGNKCENCGSNFYVGCHHKNYYNLGRETVDDVDVLCWNCHKDKRYTKEKDKIWKEEIQPWFEKYVTK